jgi:hypothetical protein
VKRWKPGKGDKLVGKRIDPKTPLGDQLAKLRLSYASAARIEPGRGEEDIRRRMMETSLNVEAPLDLIARKKMQDQRKRLIRERVQRAMDATFEAEGRYPDSIGIPRETIDEVSEACYDFPVRFVPSD